MEADESDREQALEQPRTGATVASARPWFATAAALFCAGTVVVLAARDLLVPGARDVEVWFGFELRGLGARLTAPLHWAIFAAGAYAFWTQQRSVWTAAAAYAFYVALSHLVWSEASSNGHGWLVGLAQAAVLAVPGFLLLRAGRAVRGREASAGA